MKNPFSKRSEKKKQEARTALSSKRDQVKVKLAEADKLSAQLTKVVEDTKQTSYEAIERTEHVGQLFWEEKHKKLKRIQ